MEWCSEGYSTPTFLTGLEGLLAFQAHPGGSYARERECVCVCLQNHWFDRGCSLDNPHLDQTPKKPRTFPHIERRCKFAEYRHLHIPGVQKKRNGGFSIPCELKVLCVYTSLDKASSAEENDAKINKSGWAILILCPFLEKQLFSNFAGFLRPMSEESCRDKPSIWCFVEAHWSVATKETLIKGLPQDTVWKVCPDTILR